MLAKTVAEVTRDVEKAIRTYVLTRRLHAPSDYLVPTLETFESIQRLNVGIVTTGFFNHIVADMKKTGILGTAKGGQFVFLTDEAWELHQKNSGGAK